LQQMQQTVGIYDPNVLIAVSRYFDVAPIEDDGQARPAVSVRVQDLQVGQILAGNIETMEALLVLVAGTVLTPMLLERLRNFRALGTIGNTVMVRA
jgi:hypothetical protein